MSKRGKWQKQKSRAVRVNTRSTVRKILKKMEGGKCGEQAKDKEAQTGEDVTIGLRVFVHF